MESVASAQGRSSEGKANPSLEKEMKAILQWANCCPY